MHAQASGPAPALTASCSLSDPSAMQNTPQFCETVLCDPRVTAYARSHFITWAAQVGTPAASQLTDLLRISSFPYLAVLAASPSTSAAASTSTTIHRRPQALRMLASIDGAASVEAVLRALEGAVSAASASNRGATRRATAAAEARSVREEQDAALAASMAEDRRRAEAAEAERRRVEAARQAQEDAQRADECAPPWPSQHLCASRCHGHFCMTVALQQHPGSKDDPFAVLVPTGSPTDACVWLNWRCTHSRPHPSADVLCRRNCATTWLRLKCLNLAPSSTCTRRMRPVMHARLSLQFNGRPMVDCSPPRSMPAAGSSAMPGHVPCAASYHAFPCHMAAASGMSPRLPLASRSSAWLRRCSWVVRCSMYREAVS